MDMKPLRKGTALAIVILALAMAGTTTGATAQGDTICSPSWGSGIPQICVGVPVQAEQQPVADTP
jgi:spermidine/putrescine-binding protein